MSKHTPEPWEPCGWSIDGSDGTCICEGFQDDEYEWDAPNRARIVACVNAFHSEQGREIPTEQIEPGLVWALKDTLESLLLGVPLINSMEPKKVAEARALLAKLEPRE